MSWWRFGDPDAQHIAAQYYVDAFVQFYSKKNSHGDFDELDEGKRKKVRMEAHAHLLEDLYKNLDTLDHKATSLLTFCGLVIAAIAVASSDRYGGLASDFKGALIVLFVAAAASAVMCLTITYVEWSTAASLKDRELVDACRSYYLTRQHRTWIYTLAWTTMIATTVALAIGFVVSVSLGWWDCCQLADEAARKPI